MERLVATWGKLSGRASFQILSDLHLEVGRQYNSYEIQPSAPYLILAGDIGRMVDYDDYLSFLARHVDRFKHVFLVLGNHEFYGVSMQEGLRRAALLESEALLSGRVSLLHRKAHKMPDLGLTVLGCTLWSFIPKDSEAIVASTVNDFRQIEGWTVKDHNAAHRAELDWLKGQVDLVKKSKGTRRVLITTHYAPCTEGTSDPKYKDNPWSSAFSTDLLNADDWRGVRAWVFGHTHFSADFTRHRVRVVANQRGYVFNPEMERSAQPRLYSPRKAIWV